jgi:hypothetical protein
MINNDYLLSAKEHLHTSSKVRDMQLLLNIAARNSKSKDAVL